MPLISQGLKLVPSFSQAFDSRAVPRSKILVFLVITSKLSTYAATSIFDVVKQASESNYRTTETSPRAEAAFQTAFSSQRVVLQSSLSTFCTARLHASKMANPTLANVDNILAYSPHQAIELVSRAGVKKANMRPDKIFLSAVSRGSYFWPDGLGHFASEAES